LDAEAEATLAKLREVTGLTISELLKRGLAAYEQETAQRAKRTPFDAWKNIDWGEGDPDIPQAKDAKVAVREIIRGKARKSRP
jgi:hypothetical protein